MKNNTIGEFIAMQRKQLSMTQQDLADRLNLTNKAVSKWETGEGYPDISVLPALAEILNVSVDELLKGEKNSSSRQLSNNYYIKDGKHQAQYIFENGIRRFQYLYLTCLGIVLLGIISTDLGLKLYDGVFFTSLGYSLVISISVLIVGMMFYINICNDLKRSIKKYNEMIKDTELDYNTLIYKKHILFFAIYSILMTICICAIPLYPFMSYKTRHGLSFDQLFGYDSFGRLFINYYYCLIACLVVYCICFTIAFLIIKRKSSK